jgi:SAM-dependent methyltransferase
MEKSYKKSILYILTKENRQLFYALKRKLFSLSIEGSESLIYKKSSLGGLSFSEVLDIKVFLLPPIFFRWSAIFKIFINRNKLAKVYVDDDKLFSFLQSLGKFLKIGIETIDSVPQAGLKILDVGCGGAKASGAIGVDMQTQKGVDVVCNLNKYPWPFEDNTFDLIHCISVIEHLDNIVKTMEELHRIGKDGAVIIIDTTHFAHPNSYRDPTHKWHFTLGTFDYFTGEVAYPRYSKLKFKMLKKELRFRKKYCTGKVYAFFSTIAYEKYYCHRSPPHSIYFEMEIVKH